jgi:hypothetical protein
VYDPGAGAWTELSPFRGQEFSSRCGHGFTSAHGKLYVFGGRNDQGGFVGKNPKPQTEIVGKTQNLKTGIGVDCPNSKH